MKGSPRSKNNARQTLGAFFKFAKERGWVARDHDSIDLVPKFKERSGAIQIFTPWELVQYLNHVRDELVPITDNLVKWLTPHVQKTGRVVPFDNVNKQIGWLVRDTNKELKKEAVEAGQDPEKAPKLKWKKNALRHSFISYRLADVQAAAQVALEAGNSPQIIFQHYCELVRPKDAKSWFSITPGDDGKIVYFEIPKDGEEPGAGKGKAEATEQPAKAEAVATA